MIKSVIKKNRSRSLNIMFADFCYFNRHTLHSQFTPLSIGLIAQDVEKVFPELVSTNKEGLKTVAYGNLIAPLIEALKVQESRIESQESRIESQDNKIEQLIKEIKQLKNE